MKSCPQCNKEYADNSLRFCLEDGAKLVKVSQPDATLRYSHRNPALEPTIAAGNQPLSPAAGAQPNLKRILPIVIIVVVLLAALGVAAVFIRSARQPPNANANTNASSSGLEAIPPGAEPPWVRGNPNAPVTVEEFADFQCHRAESTILNSRK